MKELVDNAGVSKGAFYNYFTSKEQVFNEVVIDFYNEIQIKDYASFSTSSLFEFYNSFLDRLGSTENVLSGPDDPTTEFGINHYYLIFDGMTLIPGFREMHMQQNRTELDEWIKIIVIARKKGEIKSDSPDELLGQLFMCMLDGVVTNLIITADMKNIKSEVTKVWDALYNQLKI